MEVTTTLHGLRTRDEPLLAVRPVAHAAGLSTTTIALAVVAVVTFALAGTIAVVALRRHRSSKSKPQPSKLQISQPELKFAPRHATEATIDLSKLTPGEKLAVSMRQYQKFQPLSAAVKNTEPAWHFPSSNSRNTTSSGPEPSSSSSEEGNTTNGFQVPQILKIPQPSVIKDKPRPSTDSRRPGRVAVPSILLDSLGDLPQLPGSKTPLIKSPVLTKPASSQPISNPLSSLKIANELSEEQAGSLTPILDLDLNFNDEPLGNGTLALEDELDFEIQRSVWLSTTLSNNFESRKSLDSSRALSNSSSNLQAPKPEALSTKPSDFNAPNQRSNVSLHPSPNRQATASAANSRIDPRKAPQGFVTVDVPDSPPRSKTKPSLPLKTKLSDDLFSSFRPLSLGLDLEPSGSQGSFRTMLFKNVRKSLWGDPLSANTTADLESGSSHVEDLSNTWTNDGVSLSSSATSVQNDSNASVTKPNVVAAASLPALVPAPLHWQKSMAELSHDSPVPSPTHVTLPVSTKSNQPSTFGASISQIHVKLKSEPVAPATLPSQQPVLTSSKSGESEPSGTAPSKSSSQASSMYNSASSSPTKPLPSHPSMLTGGQMSFMTPYHRTMYPDPPPAVRPSMEQSTRSPILAQLSAAVKSSPNLSLPRPSFSESIRACLSMSRKSNPNSPVIGSKHSTPRLNALEMLPKPSTIAEKSETNSITSSLFDNAPIEQWKVSTEDHDSKQDDTPFRPAGNMDMLGRSMPLIGTEGIGLGLCSSKFYVNQSPLTAVDNDVMSVHSAYSTAGRRTEFSVSLIIQPSKWASEKIATEGLQHGRKPSIASTHQSMHGERIDFSTFHETLQRKVTAVSAVSPLEEVESSLSYEFLTSSKNSLQTQDSMHTAHTEASRPLTAHQDAEMPWSTRMSVNSHAIASPLSDCGADTISISSSCMTDSMGDQLELAVDRRAKLLASVQQNLALDRAHDDRSSRKSSKSQPSSVSRRSEHSSQGAKASLQATNVGLGLYTPSKPTNQRSTPSKKPAGLMLSHTNATLGSNLIGPLTPPLTPVHAKASEALLNEQQGILGSMSPPIGYHDPNKTPLKSSRFPVPTPTNVKVANVMDSLTQGDGYLDDYRNFRSTPHTASPTVRTVHERSNGNDMTEPGGRRGGKSPIKLRPLSLATNSTVLSGSGGESSPSPLRKFSDRGVFSPALSGTGMSPNCSLERARQLAEERRVSRGLVHGQGGVLPTINSSGALHTGKANHTGLSKSDSKDSVGSSSKNSSHKMSNNSSLPSPSPFSTHVQEMNDDINNSITYRTNKMEQYPSIHLAPIDALSQFSDLSKQPDLASLIGI